MEKREIDDPIKNLDMVYLIQVSDIHIGEPSQKDDIGPLTDFVNGQLKHISPMKFILTGDITDSPKNTNAGVNKQQWMRYYDMLSNAEIFDVEKVIEVAGNHDSFGISSHIDPEYYYCKYAVASLREICKPYAEYQSSKNDTGIYHYDIEKEKESMFYKETIELENGRVLNMLFSDITPLPNYGHLFGYYGIIDNSGREKIKEMMGENDSSIVKIGFQHQTLHYMVDPNKIYATENEEYSKLFHELGIDVVFSGHIHTPVELVTKHSVADISLGKFGGKKHPFSLISIDMNSQLISYSTAQINTYPILNVINPPNAFLFNKAPISNNVIVSVVYPPGINDPEFASRHTKITVKSGNGNDEEIVTLHPVGDTVSFLKTPKDINGKYASIVDKDTLPIIIYTGEYRFEDKGILVIEYQVDEEIEAHLNDSYILNAETRTRTIQGNNSNIKIVNRGSTVIPYSSTVQYSKTEFRKSYPKSVKDDFHPYPKLNADMFTGYLGSFPSILFLFLFNLFVLVIYPLILFVISRIKHKSTIPNVSLYDIIFTFVSFLNVSLYTTKTEVNHLAISIFDHLYTTSFSGYIDTITDKVITDRRWIKMVDTGTVEVPLIVTCVAMWGYHAASVMYRYIKTTAEYRMLENMSFQMKMGGKEKEEDKRDKEDNGETTINISTEESNYHRIYSDTKDISNSDPLLLSSPLSPINGYQISKINIRKDLDDSSSQHNDNFILDNNDISENDETHINHSGNAYNTVRVYISFLIFFSFVGASGEVSQIIIFFSLYTPFTFFPISSIIAIIYFLPSSLFMIFNCYKILSMCKKIKS